VSQRAPEEKAVEDIRKFIQEMNAKAKEITESAKKSAEEIRRVRLALQKLTRELRTTTPTRETVQRGRSQQRR